MPTRPSGMNLLPCCTGCKCGRCMVRPTAAATPGAGWAYRPGQTPFARVERLSDRAWLVVEDDRFCEHPFMYVVLGARVTVVIDTGVGTASYGEWLSRWLAQTHGPTVASRPLLVVNTHCHYDHIGGNASLAAVGAEALAASDADRAFTCAALDGERDASLAREVGCEVASFEVTRWLANGERIALGGEDDDDALEVIWTPGHTPDSLCLWLAKERILFVGDTLYPHATIIVANRDSDLAQYAGSLRTLAEFVRGRAGAGSDTGAAGSPATPAAGAGVRLACGHVDAELPASAIEEVAALVEDARRGALAPRRFARGGDGTLLLERGSFSVSVKAAQLRAPRTAATLATLSESQTMT